MSTASPLLTVVGAGPGESGLLTMEATDVLSKAERLYAPDRYADSLRQINPLVCTMGMSEMLRCLREDVSDCTVVVSGDVGFYSLSSLLQGQLGDIYRVQYTNGLSSLQYLCSRLKIPYDDAIHLSLHGRKGAVDRLVGMVSYHAKTFWLTGGAEDVDESLQVLKDARIPNLQVTIGQDLSSPGERIVTGTPEELSQSDYSGLAVMLARNPLPANPSRRLKDTSFVRGSSPMTKEAVRTLSTAKLDIQPTDILWDVGAGTGSVSVAMAYQACEGTVWAVEQDLEAVELCQKNRSHLGAYNIKIRQGKAPDALDGLPAPDGVFIGGAGGQLEKIVEKIFMKNPCVRVCINAITLETLSQGLALLKSRDVRQLEVECVQSSQAKPVGSLHMMQANNPVYMISGRGGNHA